MTQKLGTHNRNLRRITPEAGLRQNLRRVIHNRIDSGELKTNSKNNTENEFPSMSLGEQSTPARRLNSLFVVREEWLQVRVLAALQVVGMSKYGEKNTLVWIRNSKETRSAQRLNENSNIRAQPSQECVKTIENTPKHRDTPQPN